MKSLTRKYEFTLHADLEGVFFSAYNSGNEWGDFGLDSMRNFMEGVIRGMLIDAAYRLGNDKGNHAEDLETAELWEWLNSEVSK